MPNSARFATSLSAQYRFSVANQPAFVAVTQRYVGDRAAGFVGSARAPYYLLPAYSISDLQAGMDFGRLNLTLFARNLFDERAQLGGTASSVSVGQPRTVGVTATLVF